MKLIRFKLTYLALITCVIPVFSQVKEATWYHFDQEYYKIPVYKTSGEVFKITYDFLKSNQFPVDDIDPRELQLIHRGRELAIEIEGEQDGVFDASDVLYFYGKGNDGMREKELYIDSSYQFQEYFSFYSDTTFYFLTFKNGVKGKRMMESNFNSTNSDVYKNANKIDLKLFVENFSLGQEWVSYVFRNELDLGQGFMGGIVGTNAFYNYSFSNVFIDKSTSKVQLDILLIGRNNLEHSIEIKVGDTKNETFVISGFSGANSKYVTFSIDTSLIQNNSLKVSVSPKGVNGEADAISVSYSKLYYPTDIILRDKNSSFYFSPNVSKNINFQNVDLVNKVYDITDFYKVNNFKLGKISSSESSLSFSESDTTAHQLYFFNTINSKIPK